MILRFSPVAYSNFNGQSIHAKPPSIGRVVLLLTDFFQMISDSRFKEYSPDSPLMGFGFFSFFE
jgi:hypothetical protein